MCMNRLIRNLNIFYIRIFLVVLLLFLDYISFCQLNDLVLIVLYLILVYDLYIDITLKILNKKFNYDLFVLVLISFFLFVTSQFKNAILVVLLYQLLNRLVVSFMEYINCEFVSDFLIDDNFYHKIDRKKTNKNKIKLGDSVTVLKGERVLVDGVIIKGESLFKSPFSRDSRNLKIKEGGKLLAGMINLQDSVLMRATSTEKTTLLSKLLIYMDKTNKKLNKLDTKFNKVIKTRNFFIYLVIIAYILISVFIIDNFNVFRLNLVLVLLFFTTFIGIKQFLPFVHYVTLYKLAIRGIIIRDFNTLDKYSSAKLIILNKTGVATVGEFSITEVCGDSNKIFKYLNYAEAMRDDRIAKVIKDYKYQKVDKNKISDYKFYEGEGITLKYGKDNICVGNYYLFKKNGITIDLDSIDKIGTIIYVAVNSKEIGYIVISDMIKTSIIEDVSILKKSGFNVLVMSSDNSSITCAVNREIGSCECYSSLLTDERQFFIDFVRNRYKTKAFYIADNVTDKFLEYSDFGVTLNVDSFNTISSDIAIIDDDISRIIDVCTISKAYKNSKFLFISLYIIIRLILLIFALLNIINIWVLVFGEFILIIMMIIVVLRIINDRK